jgi:nitrate reductase gamma subunit
MNDAQEYREVKVKESHFVWPVSWLFNISLLTVLVGLIILIASVVPPVNRVDQITALVIFLAGFGGALLATLIVGKVGARCPQCHTKTRVKMFDEYVHFYCDNCKIRMMSSRPRGD